MGFDFSEDEIECEIIKSYGVFSGSTKFWNKEVNLVSWNGRPAKLDIRNWQKDHAKCGKGIAITREEAEELVKLLNKILKSAPAMENFEGRKSPKRKSSPGPGNSGETPSSDSGNPKKTQFKGKNGAAGRKAPDPSPPKKAPPVPLLLKPFYDELNLSFGSDPLACKTARNKLLKKYHPDMYAGSSAFATRKTIKIKEAYEKITEWWKAR